MLFLYLKNAKQKENKNVKKNAKAHKDYCDYEIAKAKKPSRIYSVKTDSIRKPNGIRTSVLSKAMLAKMLAAMY